MESAAKSSYVYTWTRPDTGEVFYVGLGRGNRDVTPKIHNTVFMRIVAKLKRDGLNAVVERIADHLSVDEARALEISEIARIGRKHLGTGPLANLNAGGEGGADPSEETRQKISAAQRGGKHSLEARARIRAANLGKVRSAETCERIGAAKRGVVHDPKTRAKIGDALRGKPLSVETRARMCEAQSNRSPKTCAKISAALTGKPKSDEHKAKMRGIPKSSEHRAKLSASKVGKKPSADHMQKLCAGHRMSGPQSNNVSGYKGVSLSRRDEKWLAQIKLEKQTHIGAFIHPEVAARAYDAAAVNAWGVGNCYLNFPDEFAAIQGAANDNTPAADAVIAA